MLNDTHDPALRSWLPSANDPDTDFPIQNLPFGIFHQPDREEPRVGVAIGDQIVDVAAGVGLGVFSGAALEAAHACEGPTLNPLMAVAPAQVSALRAELSRLLREDGPPEERRSRISDAMLVPMSDCELLVPAAIGDYTDFYASIHHATNVGGMFRPDNPLLPNYKHLPIGYHGRASSIVASGTAVRRPSGQTYDETAATVSVGPSRALDYELELGAFVGRGNRLGEPVALADAWDHIFGFCLVNDWSARDIQRWEYQPLGPFLAKSFATTVSPWVVTTEALLPHRVKPAERPPEDPPLQPYLDTPDDRERGALDITLEVLLATAAMREKGVEPVRLSRGGFATMYWTMAQMLAHHTSNGCNLRPGDLLASGTVSGRAKDSRGCLLELTWRGSEPIELPNGETRKFLDDGDEVIIRGWAGGINGPRIGFGECRGTVAPAT
ncbi:MAG: fumarylacetoacetase [Gemmatimonadota bacterium]|nr:fumarylacetoacetase [Gemmatimonadota bacterium]